MPQKEEILRLPENWDGCEEYTETMLSGDNWRLERIISRGHVSPEGFWYEQNEDEWVTVLRGEGEIMWADGTKCTLKSGESVLIPQKCRHRVSGAASVARRCRRRSLFPAAHRNICEFRIWKTPTP